MSDTKMIKTRIALRRDQEANYSVSFVPLKGEVCLIDTASGLFRQKVGDGTTTFGNLPYDDEKNSIIYRGYYLNGKFYTDSTYTVELDKSRSKIYIDSNSNIFYNWDGTKFVSVNIPNATAEVAGMMKLYQEPGLNTDGTISQKTITTGMNAIQFAIDDHESECLILDLPWA